MTAASPTLKHCIAIFMGTCCLMACASTVPPPPPVPGGQMSIMPLGQYLCTLPGRADTAAYIRTPERDFEISFGSRYESAAGKGTYLLTGKQLLFTSGPIKGQRFERSGNNTVRALGADGRGEPLLCTRGAK